METIIKKYDKIRSEGVGTALQQSSVQ